MLARGYSGSVGEKPPSVNGATPLEIMDGGVLPPAEADSYPFRMPSHLTHQVFLEEALRRAEIEEPLSEHVAPYAVLGAQGPDIFFHNQRRKPSGLTYGSLIHRHGYGRVCASAYRYSVARSLSTGQEPLDRRSWAFAYTVGFAGHAVLDRYTHPYINYWAGWAHHDDPSTERLRGMHPFLERLVDIRILRRYRNTAPVEYGFYDQVNCSPADSPGAPPESLVSLLEQSLRATYRRAAEDSRLPDRIRSAYRDSMSYYQFTDCVDESYVREGLRRERAGEIAGRWLSIIHPPVIPRAVDVMNNQHRWWCHPCNRVEEHHESFWDLLDEAQGRMVLVAQTFADAWMISDCEETVTANATRIETMVGNENLSDGRKSERPCRKHHSDPLPLPELQQKIKELIESESVGQGAQKGRLPER